MKVYKFKNTLTDRVGLTILKNDAAAKIMLLQLGKNWTCRTIN